MAICLATSAVWRCGSTSTLVTKAMSRGHRGEVAEQGEDLVEGVLGRVRRRREGPERTRAEPLGRGPEDVVVGHDVVEAGLLGADRPRPDRAGSVPLSACEKITPTFTVHVSATAHRGSTGFSPATMRAARSAKPATLSGWVRT